MPQRPLSDCVLRRVLPDTASCETGILTFIRSVYEASFPQDERRPFNECIGLLSTPHYGMEAVFLDDAPAGFIAFWRLREYVFIEHFAMSAGVRGRGAGSAALREFMRRHAGPVVLEVELPESGENARRRIAFYERLGFSLCDAEHVQPPYTPQGRSVPLRFMSCPGPLDTPSLNAFREALFTHVYPS